MLGQKGGRSRNGIERARLSNVRGTRKAGEWVKVRRGGSKRVENPIGVDIKNRFSILEDEIQMWLVEGKMKQMI